MAATEAAGNPWDNPTLFGPWGESAFIVTYGQIGVGKSTAAALAFPDAWTLRAPGGVKGSYAIIGEAAYARLVAQSAEVSTIQQCTGFLHQIAAGQYPRKPVHLDDMSLIAQNTLAGIWAAYKNDKRYTLQVYSAFKSVILEFRDAARRARVHVAADAHIAPMKIADTGKTVPAGPDFGAPSVQSTVSAVADMIYEVVPDPTMYPWPRAYLCEPARVDQMFKDRHGVVNGRAPQNLREILLAADYRIPRPGLEHVDAMADKIAEVMAARTTPTDFVAIQKLGAEMHAACVRACPAAPKSHAYWAVFDGVARWMLRAQKSPLDQLLSQVPAVPAAPAFGAAPAASLTPTDAPAMASAPASTPEGQPLFGAAPAATLGTVTK